MIRAMLRLAMVALLLAGTAGRAARAEQRVALVIGNGVYLHAPKLDTPASDAKLISATLQLLGFTVIGGGALIDLDRPSFERMLHDFRRLLEPGTTAVFYYAGLGLQTGGTNYLVPVTANLTSAADADFELINLDAVVGQMAAAHAALNLVLLDAARGNPFGLSAVSGLAEMHPPSGTVISSAAQPGQVAREGDPHGDSPYAVALAKALRLPGIDVVKALATAGQEVSAATGGSQVPWLSQAPSGAAVYLVSAPAAAMGAEPPAPPPMVIYPPASPDPDTLFWHSIERANRREDLEAYLQKFPDGTFADLARTRLALLPAPPPPPVVEIGAEQISEAQRLLLAMGISRGTVTARADARLAEALRIYQRAARQPETGMLTLALLEALRQPPPDAAARAAAVFGFAGEALRGGRSADAAALYEEGLRLDPGDPAAQHALAELRKPPPVRPVVQRPPPPPEPPPRRTSPPPAPPPAFAATAMNLRGQQFRTGAGSEAAAVSAALAMCRAVSWECRIVAMSGPPR